MLRIESGASLFCVLGGQLARGRAFPAASERVRKPVSLRSESNAIRLTHGVAAYCAAMAPCRTTGFAVAYRRYLRSAFVAKPGIMNTIEMAKPTIRTVLKGKVLAMVLMAMLTTVEPT